MQHLLSSLDQGGLIGPHIAPLMARLDAIIGAGEVAAREVRKRIRLLSFGTRKTPLEHLSLIGSAVFKRHRLKMESYRAQHSTPTRRARCRRSASSITARTGISTPGVVHDDLQELFRGRDPTYRNDRHAG